MTRGVARGLFLVGIAAMLVVAANVWVANYVTTERYIYSWDSAGYWLMFQDLGAGLRSDALSALKGVASAVSTDGYNPVPLLPLLPFEAVFGSGRLAYILAITNAALVPSAILLALLVHRAMSGSSPMRLLVCAAAILGMHVLWAPVVRGLPDVAGVAVAAVILLVYFNGPVPTRSLKRLAAVGLLLCLLTLTRRYYLFWTISFFPAAVAAYLSDWTKADLEREKPVRFLGGLALAAVTCGAAVMILAAPLVLHVATANYSVAFSAYQPDAAGSGALSQIVDHFGLSLLALCLGGLVWLAVRAETRRLGVFLIVQAVFAVALFSTVQTLLGPHHFYLLVPAAGAGLAALVAGLWNATLARGWRAAGVAAVLLVIALNSAATFSAFATAQNPLWPRKRFAPSVRDDLGEMQRLMTTLTASGAGQIYVAASSETLNWSVLKTGCRTMQPDLCAMIPEAAEIDLRDGFPRRLLDSDYVLVATPTQYHLRAEDQLVVGLVAQEIREGRGIGESFTRLPEEFHLTGGMTATIYQLTAPLSYDAVKALSAKLQARYPQAKDQFEPPLPCEDGFVTGADNCAVYAL